MYSWGGDQNYNRIHLLEAEIGRFHWDRAKNLVAEELLGWLRFKAYVVSDWVKTQGLSLGPAPIIDLVRHKLLTLL